MVTSWARKIPSAFEDSSNAVRKVEARVDVIAGRGAYWLYGILPVLLGYGAPVCFDVGPYALGFAKKKCLQIEDVRAKNDHILPTAAMVALASPVSGERRADFSTLDHLLHRQIREGVSRRVGDA